VGTKSYRPWAPHQPYLLPPSPREWLPEGHLAYFILDVVERLDLGAIEAAIAAKDPRGERPYSPRLMVALLIYGYCVGIFSSRKLARATYEDVAVRVLAGEAHPFFTTLNQFRLDHREAFAALFLQVLRLCRRAGLVKLGHVALDGTKVKANASKHKAMSYERMTEEEARLRGEINELLAQADAVDAAEDKRYGVGVAPEDLPEELRRREARLERITQAMAELEGEAARTRAQQLRQNAEAQWARAQDESIDNTGRGRAATRAAKSEARAAELDPPDDEDPPPPSADDDLPQHQVPANKDGQPDPKAQRNFSDPDSRIMVEDGAYVQAYNAQLVVDEKSQVIVAQAVTNLSPDQPHVVSMLDRVERNAGRKPKRISMDNGYYSDANANECAGRGIDAYIAAGRTPHGEGGDAARTLSPTRAAMKAKVDSPEGHAVYARRKVIVEPAIGQIKAAQGFRRFSLRGLAKVRCEWAWVCMTHNLLKLFRATWAPRWALQA
jgi:transposase